MENGPETTSQVPSNALLSDAVPPGVGSDTAANVAETVDLTGVAVIVENVSTDVDEVTVPDVPSAEAVLPVLEESSESPAAVDTDALDVREAPAPQPVHLFDMGDDLGTASDNLTTDSVDENVVSNVHESEPERMDIPDCVIAVEANQEVEPVPLPLVNPVALQTDDEIFEQVMGSSRVEDIPVPRRSTPGSIPLPPQLAEEHARNQRSSTPATADTRGRKHPLPVQQRRSQHQGATGQTPAGPVQPSAPPSVDVICPKCQRTTSTRFTFCMKCGTDFPPGYIASLTGHSQQAATPDGRSGVRDTRTTVRQINRIHEARGNGTSGHRMGTAQASGEEELPRLHTGTMANPFLVAFLSFLMPGLGHMLMGEYKKGLPWLFAGIAAMAFLPSWTFLMWVPLLLRVFSAFNAYQLATIKQDEQRGPFDTDDDA